MAAEKLLIGSNFGVLNFYNENGTAVEQAPYVTLHSKETGKYYVADSVTPNEDGVSYDAVFTAAVTARMTPRLYNLEVFTDSTMQTNTYYEEDYAIALVVSPTPGQTNNSAE